MSECPLPGNDEADLDVSGGPSCTGRGPPQNLSGAAVRLAACPSTKASSTGSREIADVHLGWNRADLVHRITRPT
ncbi:hypothetical protein [Lichenibacterium ramalinae]|uniref:hypothetical protein n=1 Tax=Lichenibacterium ramalinae TaxID=2316527 RepID=UPI00100E74E9|nr:hypothetical protein [Lichenibacterium ramalinae]